jgi:hypothetical protein
MLGLLSVQARNAPPGRAASAQVHGGELGRPQPRFVTDPNIPVGLSQPGSYPVTYSKATVILNGLPVSWIAPRPPSWRPIPALPAAG